MNEKAQIFIIGALAIIGLILSVTSFSGQIFVEEPRKNFVLELAKTEIPRAYYFGLIQKDLNNSLWNAAKTIKNLGTASGQKTKIAFVGFDQNTSFVIGNFTGKSCFFESEKNKFSKFKVLNNTIQTKPKETLLNDYSIIFCGESFDLNQYLQFFAVSVKGKEVGRWDNLGKQT